MRLHTLTLQAIGPFAGRHTIDFSALSAGGLFLLEGPTGAGKSTVIDAIVFALYGKVASAAASEDRLRSAFADDATESVVDLVLETGSGVYRVRRTPAYQRAKKKGTGTVRQQATVKLWRLTTVPDRALGADGDQTADPQGDPAGEIVSTRLDEAGAELARIVGLDRTQFVQTMVLPQGEFASFLRADPEQRRVLLQRIFGTEVYQQVQDRLDEDRREVQRALAAGRQEVAQEVARFVGAAALDEAAAGPLLAAAEQDTVEMGRLVTAHLTDLRDTTATRDDLTAVATRTLSRAQAAEQHAADRLRWARRREDLLHERSRLLDRAEEHRADVERHESASRAAVVAPVLRGLDGATAALAGARKELTAAVDGAPAGLLPGEGAPAGLLPGDGPAAVPSEQDAPALRVARDRSAARVATLARLVAMEEALPGRAARVDDLRTAATAAAEQAAEVGRRLADRPGQRTILAEVLAAATDLAGTVDARRHEQEDARSVLAAAQEEVRVAGALAGATAERSEAAAAALAAATAESDLRTARLRGFAGELAGGLRNGEPCPVCGSRQHPAPAALGAGHVTEEQVAAAESRRTAAEAVLRTADGQVAALTERHAALVERSGGRSVQQAEEEVATAAAAWQRAADAVTARDRCTAALTEHDQQTDRLREQQQTRGQQQAGAEARLAAAVGELERDSAEVAAARGEHPTVAAHHGAEQARVEAADTLLTALTACAQATADLAARRTEADRVLVENGFAGADGERAARAAHLPDEQLALVRTRVEQHRSALAQVDAGLADPRVGELQDAAVADLVEAMDRAATEAGAARAVSDRVHARAAADRDRFTASVVAADRVHHAGVALDERERAAAPVVRMARLATGSDNPQALSLATYVLLRRFEDVVAAANDRLRPMSDGRFEVESSDEREDVRARKRGLAMRVLDHTTGATRDPRTLSGGETFYVSLCLALGMADVVTAEAGGIELGTLFIDEGFGSLDPHTLDAVLAELGHLRAGGRVVGLVSHVEAMKAAVAERIQVRRRADGSSTLTVVAG